MDSAADVRDALDALRRIVRALRLSATEVERGAGLSMAQLFVLEQLADGRPRSIVELAEATLTDPSSTSAIVARLVDHRLLARKQSAADHRRAELTLTAAGKRRLAAAPHAPQSALLAALRKLAPPRRKALARDLAAVAEAMGAEKPHLFFEDERRRKHRGS